MRHSVLGSVPIQREMLPPTCPSYLGTGKMARTDVAAHGLSMGRRAPGDRIRVAAKAAEGCLDPGGVEWVSCPAPVTLQPPLA